MKLIRWLAHDDATMQVGLEKDEKRNGLIVGRLINREMMNLNEILAREDGISNSSMGKQ